MNGKSRPKAATQTPAKKSETSVTEPALADLLRHALTPDTARLIASLLAGAP